MRDAQISALEHLTRTLAQAQAELAERTEDLRRSNASKADLEQHLRAEYERQKERGIDLAARTQELQKMLDELKASVDEKTQKEEATFYNLIIPCKNKYYIILTWDKLL